MATATQTKDEAETGDVTDAAKMVFGESDAKLIGAEHAPEGSYVLRATLVNHGGTTGSASGGKKAHIKFEIDPEALAQLILDEAIGQMSFDVTFAQTALGSGLTIGPYSGRPDEDGQSRSWINLIVPETQQKKLASIYSRELTSKHAALVLNPIQTSMDDMLTTKAE